MRTAFVIAFVATTAAAQVPVGTVADDARVLARVAEKAKGDLPHDLLRRIVEEDIELLRGKRADGTFQYAAYERMEAGRISDSYSVQPRKNGDELTKIEMRGDAVYRLVLSVPSRRLVVTKNRRLWVDRVEIESISQGSSAAKTQTVPIGAWLEPGTTRPIDFDAIARQATVRIYARADRGQGYGNLALTLIRAKIFDLPDSPYADAVASAKAILRAIDNGDAGTIRSLAQRMEAELRPVSTMPVATVTTSRAEPPPPPVEVLPASDIHSELQKIEDLLTGSESERREGLDRLHQLIRRLRSR